MRWLIDTAAQTVSGLNTSGDLDISYPLSSPEGLDVVAQLYQNSGWHLKASYGFSWLGTPIVQLPEDMVRLQEAIVSVKPNVIIETGVSRGGSILFYASLCHLLALEGQACRVIGVDHNIWPETREHLESHPLYSYITLIDGDSKSPEVVLKVSECLTEEDACLVTLDSAHDKAHVLEELTVYAPFVSVGSYIVVQDGLMKHVTEGPRSQPDWDWNNPENAAHEFLEANPNFVHQEPERVFTQSRVKRYPTQWPFGWLKRIQ